MQVVRYKQGKITFEVGCKVGNALKYKKGQLGFENVLVSEEIWKDIKKGDRASNEELKAAFKTEDIKVIAKTIVDDGEIQFNDTERKEMIEKKRNEIINYIHKYYIDPKTKTMIPVNRIDNALTELKIRIDMDQATDKQIQDIIKKLPEVLSIKRSEITGNISATHQHVAAVTGVLKKHSITILSENFTDTGCSYSVSMVPGDYDKVIADLNTSTKGNFEFNIDGQVGDPTPEKTPAKGKGRGGGGRGTTDTGGGGGRRGGGGRKK